MEYIRDPLKRLNNDNVDVSAQHTEFRTLLRNKQLNISGRPSSEKLNIFTRPLIAIVNCSL